MAHFRIFVGAGNRPAAPIIRKIEPADLKSVLAKGIEDFAAMPSHVVFLSLIYPIVGVLPARMTFGNDLIHLLFPLTAGFALIGPFDGEPSPVDSDALTWAKVLACPDCGGVMRIIERFRHSFSCSGTPTQSYRCDTS